MSISFKKILRSFTGFSTPVFGISWTPPESEREIVRKLIIFLEDKRAICGPYDRWNGFRRGYFCQSVLNIREELTQTLQQLDEDAKAVPVIRAMRGACRKLLSEPDFDKWLRSEIDRPDDFQSSIGEFRGVFGVHLAQLCTMYGLNLNEYFMLILPMSDTEEPSDLLQKLRKAKKDDDMPWIHPNEKAG